MNELERLITEFGNASFDCGEYDDSKSENHVYVYGKIKEKSDNAKQALLDYIEENYRRRDED
jgi:hypothetical protein